LINCILVFSYIINSVNEGDKEESNEPDYNEDKDQLEEKQEEETDEITVNQVF
jgi:hypothetical protein